MSNEHFVCPHCGHPEFSWIVRQVQFGPAAAYKNDEGEFDVSLIGDGMGPITDSDDDPVVCTGCEEHVHQADLVLEDADVAEKD